MPDISLPPINQCSRSDASNTPDTEGTVVPPSPTLVTSEPDGEELGDAAGGRAGADALVRRFSGEGAGPEAPEVNPEPPFEQSCGAEVLRAVGACGAMLLTVPVGPAFPLAVVSCASSLWALDDCVAETSSSR